MGNQTHYFYATRSETYMLTLFVVQSRADKLDPTTAVTSFHDLADEIYFVPNIHEINDKTKRNEWYAVIYDDEYIDEALKEGLKVFVKESDVDVLVLGKKTKDAIFKAPRLFRNNIKLSKQSLMPEVGNLHTFETVLNGWIYDNN